MIYTLEAVPKPNPLLPWIYIFMSLSIKQFGQVYDKLNFPFSPSEDLRQIAHDFVTIEEINRGNSVPDTPSVDLLEVASPKSTYLERREILFTNTFSHLERMGYAEAIYHWGKETHKYYPYKHIQALEAWCHLLREWTVVEFMRQQVSSEHKFYSNEWDEVVTKFVPIYTESAVALEPLSLPLATCAKLQAIVMHHEAKQIQLEGTMEQIIASPLTTWEDFALRHGAANTWIRLEGHFRINLHEWEKIVDTVTSDEMQILEQWAFQHKNQHSNLIIPIPNFHVSS